MFSRCHSFITQAAPWPKVNRVFIVLAAAASSSFLVSNEERRHNSFPFHLLLVIPGPKGGARGNYLQESLMKKSSSN